MPDKLGPSTPSQKVSRLSEIFAEAESIIFGLAKTPEVVELIPPKYQTYVAVVAASVGTIREIASMFTHPDAQAVAVAATGGDASATASSGSVVPSASTSEVVASESTDESTSAPSHDAALAEYAATQAQLASKEPLPPE